MEPPLKLKNYNVNFAEANSVQQALEMYFSKAEITRKQKEKAIKVGTNPYNGRTWVKVGKHIIILVDKPVVSESEMAMVWWEYHFQILPKQITWTDFS